MGLWVLFFLFSAKTILTSHMCHETFLTVDTYRVEKLPCTIFGNFLNSYLILISFFQMISYKQCNKVNPGIFVAVMGAIS